MKLLEINRIYKSFNGIKALSDVNMTLEQGNIYAFIGPNGAGKTTLLNLINGLLSPTAGSIYIDGENIKYKTPNDIFNLGVGRLFQNVRTLSHMTLIENIILAKQFKYETNPILSVLKGDQDKELSSDLEKASKLLIKFGLGNLKDTYAGDLSYGQGKILSFIRLLFCDPDIFLLDEPVAGLDLEKKEIVYTIVKNLAKKNKIVVIVEHEMEAIHRVANYVFFMNNGKILNEGSPQEVLADRAVINLYLGLEQPTLKIKESINKNNTLSKNLLLKVEDLYAGYGKKEILKGVNIQINKNEIVGLIGPNGAGKSTLLKVISGILPAKHGNVYFSHKGNLFNLSEFSSRTRVSHGIGYYIQGGEIFSDLSVEDNLNISAVGFDRILLENRKDLLFHLFNFLDSKRREKANLLSGGEKQILAIAMMLMSKPKKLLLLDEPSAGISPKYSEMIYSQIAQYREMFSVSVLIIEQKIGKLIESVDRFYIMKRGRIVQESVPNQDIIGQIEKIYMGEFSDKI